MKYKNILGKCRLSRSVFYQKLTTRTTDTVTDYKMPKTNLKNEISPLVYPNLFVLLLVYVLSNLTGVQILLFSVEAAYRLLWLSNFLDGDV